MNIHLKSAPIKRIGRGWMDGWTNEIRDEIGDDSMKIMNILQNQSL